MCGIAGIAGAGLNQDALRAMVHLQRHRGPDSQGLHVDDTGQIGLGHARLSILDLSDSGRQPMFDARARRWIVFNGEIYNYLELREQLRDYPFRSRTDTEVILAAFDRWGPACLTRFIGMFAFAIWDERERKLWIARDRFGVKPLYYSQGDDGTLCFASEIKALHAAGTPAEPDEEAWATYLALGAYDHSERTFWKGISSLPAGHTMTWQDGRVRLSCWYDLADAVGMPLDERDLPAVEEEYLSLLTESVRLRFRSDVPVGINLSGGLDSAVLLGVVHRVQGADSNVRAYTFVTGDARYDELPWVTQMLRHTRHPSIVCPLRADQVAELAEQVQYHQDEPYGGLPTLAYARLFEQARADGVLVLLDGQGMDEQWAGYDYYASVRAGNEPPERPVSTVQGTKGRVTRPECLLPSFLSMAGPLGAPQPFPDALRNLQYRDACLTKIPRALRFNDRISMRASVELREPFLDHRLFELALRQPPQRKIAEGQGKWLLRRLARRLLPQEIAEAPKRPLQTPQREWLRDELSGWAGDWIENALNEVGGRWLDVARVREEWSAYRQGQYDSSYHIWQWIGIGLFHRLLKDRSAPMPLPA
ncbi:MAG: asparagine synthase (glutamine-hydrolyzing) [Pirellulaceae bacterium]